MRSQAEELEDDTGGQRVVEIRGAGDLNTGEGGDKEKQTKKTQEEKLRVMASLRLL